MADIFVYIVQSKGGFYHVRFRLSHEEYLKDLEGGEREGYSLTKSFRVSPNVLGEVFDECSEFGRKRISLGELEKKIQILINAGK